MILRTESVLKATGLSRTTLWRLEKNGQFPPRRKLSARLVGWLETEVAEWVKNRQPVDAQ